jgi:hypothetical protein
MVLCTIASPIPVPPASRLVVKMVQKPYPDLPPKFPVHYPEGLQPFVILRFPVSWRRAVLRSERDGRTRHLNPAVLLEDLRFRGQCIRILGSKTLPDTARLRPLAPFFQRKRATAAQHPQLGAPPHKRSFNRQRCCRHINWMNRKPDIR